jgi:hypothetical protein
MLWFLHVCWSNFTLKCLVNILHFLLPYCRVASKTVQEQCNLIFEYSWPDNPVEGYFENRFSPTISLWVIHCTENSRQIFPEMKLRGLVPNFCIHASVSDLYFPTIGPLFCRSVLRLRTYGGNIEIAHRHMNVEIRNKAARSFISGNIFSNFRYNFAL